MPKSRGRGKHEIKAPEAHELTDGQIMALVELHGVAYFHSSGCVVLNNGTWLQLEQWQVRLDQMINDCETGDSDGTHTRTT
jgi:hypothetical protein